MKPHENWLFKAEHNLKSAEVNNPNFIFLPIPNNNCYI